MAFDLAGGSNGELFLDYDNNFPPSSSGESAKLSLINKGWNVQTN